MPADPWHPDARRARPPVVGLTLLALAFGCGQSPSDPVPDDPQSNTAPTADAGTDRSVSAGLPVGLTGSGTDPDGDVLTYSWTLTGPSGTAASLDDATSPTPAFTPDLAGDYVASLVVSDGTDASQPAAVTITAVDNTATQTIGSGGGSITSTDGKLTLAVPPGALSADEDISVTLVSDTQLPASLANLGGATTAYALEPSGLQFATPAEVTFTIDDAVTTAPGSVEQRGELLYSESAGVVELLDELEFEASATDPTQVVAKGTLDHFSYAAAVQVSGLEFRIEAPTSAEVDEVFDVTVTVDITGARVGNLIAAVMDDLSSPPIAVEGNLNSVLTGSGTQPSIVNQYTCTDVGTGAFGALIVFDAANAVPFATLRVGLNIDCVGPPAALLPTFTQVFRAGRFALVPGTTHDLTLGGGLRRFDAASAQLTLDDPSRAPEWLHALSDGTYLANYVLGDVHHVDPTLAPMRDTIVEVFNQPRDMRPLGTDAVAVINHFGDFGILRYAGARRFTDAFRNLSSVNPQQPNIHLQAMWATPDGQIIVGVETTGNGNAAVDPARLVLVEPDEAQGTVGIREVVSTGAAVLNERVDPLGVARDPELACTEESPEVLLCVLTNGLSSSGVDGGESRNGGLMKIFRLDVVAGSALRLASDNTAARIVGAIVSSTDGSRTYATVLNQRDATLEVWQIQGTSFIPAAAATFPLGNECPNPVDMIALEAGERVVIACHTRTNGPQAGILMLENLPAVLQSLP